MLFKFRDGLRPIAFEQPRQRTIGEQFPVGLAAGTIWGAVVGGSSLSVRTGLVGMGSGLVGHLLAILLSTPVNRILNFWPEGTDPAAFIFGVWIMATVLATVIGSAAAGALYRRPNPYKASSVKGA